MANKINNIDDLMNVCIRRYNQLEDISPTYLNEAGLAAKEAYRNTLWYSGFYDTLEDLSTDADFKELVSIPDKHPEYYKVLRMINRAIERAIAK